MTRLNTTHKYENRLSNRILLGSVIILLWFFLFPESWKLPIYEVLQSFLGIHLNFISGIIDISILLIACIICKYPFFKEPISSITICRQFVGAVVLLSIVIVGSLLFVKYTNDYQGNDTLLNFIFHQIIFVGLLEELLFRGILIWMLRKFISSDVCIIFVSSMVFALSHLGTDVFSTLQITSSFIIGIIFSVLIMKVPKYYSIYNIALVHGMFNVIVLGFTTYMQVK